MRGGIVDKATILPSHMTWRLRMCCTKIPALRRDARRRNAIKKAREAGRSVIAPQHCPVLTSPDSWRGLSTCERGEPRWMGLTPAAECQQVRLECAIMQGQQYTIQKFLTRAQLRSQSTGGSAPPEQPAGARSGSGAPLETAQGGCAGPAESSGRANRGRGTFTAAVLSRTSASWGGM